MHYLRQNGRWRVKNNKTTPLYEYVNVFGWPTPMCVDASMSRHQHHWHTWRPVAHTLSARGWGDTSLWILVNTRCHVFCKCIGAFDIMLNLLVYGYIAILDILMSYNTHFFISE